jgi:hypothetical protein
MSMFPEWASSRTIWGIGVLVRAFPGYSLPFQSILTEETHSLAPLVYFITARRVRSLSRSPLTTGLSDTLPDSEDPLLVG